VIGKKFFKAMIFLYKLQLGEDGDSIVVRLYEAFGGHVLNPEVSVFFPFKTATKCSILEEAVGEPLAAMANKENESIKHVSLGTIRPFEIVSLKFVF
jgi:alpha-mannosidase